MTLKKQQLSVASITAFVMIAILLLTQIVAPTVKSQETDTAVEVYGIKPPQSTRVAAKEKSVPPKLSEREFECLAKNVYFEAGNQSNVGKIAVALVTLNRANDPRFPKTICEVISQGTYANPNKDAGRHCQFSWYCSGKSRVLKKDSETWQSAKDLAYDALRMFHNGLDITNGATHFHATYVRPGWANHLEKVARIDDHIFYKSRKI